jgi:hypothetical protein
MKSNLRTLVLIWLGWFVVLYSFQAIVEMRVRIARPDYAVEWAPPFTMLGSDAGKIYLLEPYLNRQVAWDSEYYLGIAVGGYDDPKARAGVDPANGHSINFNYSFFPLYPYTMRLLMVPLNIFGKDPIATAALAGVIVSLLGTLAGMIGLWDLTRDLFGEEHAYRAIFYMLIFPTAFFFAQVYTEGMFIGLAFGSLALSRRKKWLWASVLAMFAALVRAHGAALALPLGIAALRAFDWKSPWKNSSNWKWILQAVFAFLPLAAYGVWRLSSLGQGWAELQTFYFARGFFSIPASISSWQHNLFVYAPTNPQAEIYYGMEAASVLIALSGALWLLRRSPEIALFSLAVILLSILSGSAQSMARYMLIAPAMYVMLADFGKHRFFDRTWTIASLLFMGMSAMLFTFNMWVG